MPNNGGAIEKSAAQVWLWKVPTMALQMNLEKAEQDLLFGQSLGPWLRVLGLVSKAWWYVGSYAWGYANVWGWNSAKTNMTRKLSLAQNHATPKYVSNVQWLFRLVEIKVAVQEWIPISQNGVCRVYLAGISRLLSPPTTPVSIPLSDPLSWKIMKLRQQQYVLMYGPNQAFPQWHQP